MSSIPLHPRKHVVTLEYCVFCDYNRPALAVAVDMVRAYQHVIERLDLIMGSKGVFVVVVDDETIFSKADAGRFPNDGEILELFEQAVGTELEKYPRP